MKKPRKFAVIAIDGPAGSGKSTTAKLVAKKLGFLYLDTGAMYRALTYKVLQKQADPNSAKSLEKVMRDAAFSIQTGTGKCIIFSKGKDLSSKLRSRRVEAIVSQVSGYPNIRRKMVRLQRQISKIGNLVIEGRDTTTVVFPDADLKIYLKAKLQERARRKAKLERLDKTKIEQHKRELSQRDRADSGRPLAPLKKSEDSITIDTTHLTIDQQVQKILRLYHQRIDYL
ncbi:MAG: cytidylate kinase [candidate division Zixibacteria bacterium RBG_16_48_11]|nr:MAG: cytidylate kinase [candidate division Zixibacteria bacterium RBG_16_48_11]